MSAGQARQDGCSIRDVGAYSVDIGALWGIAHSCRPELCRKMRGCCEVYDVIVTREELSCIIGMVDAGNGSCAELKRLSCANEFFEEEGGGVFSITTDDNMRCVFAHRSRQGLRCYLHSSALRLGLNPYRTKPRSCAIWPLALSEGRRPRLAVPEDAFEFPCNRRRAARGPLADGIRDIVREVFGETFLGQIEAVGPTGR